MRRHWAMTMRISTKARNVLNIWMRNQSSLLKIVKNWKNLIEIFIFNWIFVVDDWFRSTRRIERTIKFSTTTTKKILMNKWFAYKMQNCSKIDTLKNKKWCRFVYVQIIVWMMLSIVMRKVWIDWFKNYERQSVNLCTIIANQLPDHHSFSMKWRQNSCQKSNRIVLPYSISSNLILCHNKFHTNDSRFVNSDIAYAYFSKRSYVK